MKLKTTVGSLLEGFALVTPTLDRKGSSANLYLNANDQLGYLYLYSTNLIAETATKIKCKSIETSGEVLVFPGNVSDALAGLPKDMEVSLALSPEGNVLRGKAGQVKFSMATHTAVRELADRMKSIPNKNTPPTVTIPTAELAEFTKRAIFCIPNDQTGQRANLAALKLSTGDEKEEALATDGSIAVHISSTRKQSKSTSTGSNSLLLPTPTLQPLFSLASKKKGEDVGIIITEKKNKAFFRFADGTHFGILAMVTPYPNLKPVIEQKMDYYFEINRENFKLSLNRCSSYMKQDDRIVELEIGKENIKFKATGSDKDLSDQVDITYKGTIPENTVTVGMNIDYLLNVTTSSSSNTLSFGVTSDDKPLIVIDHQGEDEDRIDVRYVIMGVKSNKGASHAQSASDPVSD